MPKQTWADRFKEGLNTDSDENDYRLRGVIEFIDNSNNEEEELFAIGWNTLAHSYIHKSLTHLESLVDATESPIEVAMLFALCVTAHEQASNIRYKIANRIFGDFEDTPDLLVIEPQAKLGEYRVDFLLSYQEGIPDHDNPSKLKDGTLIPGVKEVTVHLIVECDGHDYHDRTKEQASKDRERDRELKKLGYEVFRYTGSDIWKNPMLCASEAIQVLIERVWNN